MLLRAVVALMLAFLPYQAYAADSQRLAGKLAIIGSDTLGSLTSVWSEILTRSNPKVLVQVRAVGSAAAPTALIQGTADIGPMSRRMSPDEQQSFLRRYGYPPTAVPVAEDAVAVFVHRDNPLEEISIPELDAIFSITRRCGYEQPIDDWSTFGLGGDWSSRFVTAYGRSAASGTYSFFRQHMLCAGDFSPRLNRLVGSSAIVRAVATDLAGIGYASAGYVNANVKMLRVIARDGVSRAALSRRLFVYVNRAPGSALDPLLAAFIRVALGPDGQREVARAGYLPLAEGERAALLESLGIPRV